MIPQHGTLEISRSRLAHNLNLIRTRLAPNTKICATVKADAYGHGLAQISSLLHAQNVQWLAVYSIDEALDIAPLPWFGILVLAPFVVRRANPFLPETLQKLRGQIRINIVDASTAIHLSAALINAGIEQPVNVHIQVDTGLTRSGAAPDTVPNLADTIANLPALHLEGIFAHFSHADVPAHETIHSQSAALHTLAQSLRQKYPHLLAHVQNSAAAWNLPTSNFDLARIGIALYGLQPSTANPIPNLQPIARLTAPILALHHVPANTGVGYNHSFTTRRPSHLAIVPVGYAEGYPRALSSNCIAQIADTDVPIVGRVSMDQVILDLTDIPIAAQPKIGDKLTLISWDPSKPNSIDKIADTTHTIGYEIATHLGPRLTRTIVD